MPVAKTKQAIAAFAQGRPVIVLDDEGRENEGDLIMAAERVTPEAMDFMIRYTSKVVCAGLPGRRLDELRLPLMVTENNEAMRTAFNDDGTMARRPELERFAKNHDLTIMNIDDLIWFRRRTEQLVTQCPRRACQPAMAISLSTSMNPSLMGFSIPLW